jgi:hypothetical protein
MAILRGTDVSPRVIDEPKAVVLFTRTTCRACNNVVKLLEQISEEMPDVRMVHVVEDKTRGAMMFGKGLKRLVTFSLDYIHLFAIIII